jgi:zinc and cadmium transporter
MSLTPVLLAGATFVSTLAGGLVAVRLRDRIGILAAFAAGLLIAVPLFDLLPEALRVATMTGVATEWVFGMVAIGFVFLHVLSRYIMVHRVCVKGVCHNERHAHAGLVGAVELSVHSYMDGLAIGLGFQLSFQVGAIVALAVIAHDAADGLNTVTVMMSSGNSSKASLRMLVLDAAAPILGVVTTLLFALPKSALALILPFFAGGFFYLGASDLLPEAHEKNPPLVAVGANLAGFAIIFVITRLLA